ncbi:MAG: FAD-dependent oxidoreductase [Candidatus Magasanikbacteria bacterium]|nr:FAD-dependent oxidoreductase [Candidatus Magasanikbacteria bacterium]
MPEKTKADILILGAGIGGYAAFKNLAKELKENNIDKKITLIDANNYFTFTPLLHEVASGSIEPGHATIPLQELVYGTSHQYIKTTVEKIFPEKNKVQTSIGDIEYEYCVIAVGSGVNYYGIKGAAEFSYSVRTLRSAMQLRSSIIKKLESCDRELDINVVGGGFTGIEVAGQVASLAQHDIKKLYPKTKINISIIQATDKLAPQLPPKAQEKIIAQLNKLKIKILFNAKVTEVKASEILLGKETINSDFTIWCAGVENLAGYMMDASYCERDRIPVNNFLQHKMYANLYGVGDIACGSNKDETTTYPQIGEVAESQGLYVGQHLAYTLMKKTLPPFHFRSQGTLMPIGDNYGIIVFPNGFVLSGFIAWWIRRTVYIIFVPGFLRKLKIILDWTLNLFGFRYTVDISGD